MYLCFTTILSFLICGSVFADTCSIERYDDLKKIRVFLSQNNLVLATLDAQIRESQRSLEVLDTQAKETRTSISAKLDTARKFYGEQQDGQHSLSIDLNSDLTLWNKKPKQQLIAAKREIAIIENKQIDTNYKFELYSKLVSFGISKTLASIYEEQAHLIEQSLSYVELKQENGISSTFEVAQLNVELLEVFNKLSAVKQRQKSLLLDFDKSFEFFKDLNFSYQQIKNFTVPLCGSDSLDVEKAKFQLEKATHEFTLENLSRYPQLSGQISLNSDFSGNDGVSAGVNLKIPIYSAGVIRTGLKRALSKKENAVDKLQISILNQKKVRIERQAIDALRSSNITLLANRMEVKNHELSSFSERQELGQTVFEELNSLKIEKNAVNEALVNAYKDLYLGWLEFLTFQGGL